ncbi:Co2+/Mg2+ efflux protein ApaG [Algoriphagus sp. AGSA1]|uniref:Co2+/Mg2+ efflux protein ApaG n=1 Tax=Algoriphagus sp. AGSA1 TaxID=2907213 RepID=UPI001F3659F2|nr:Co2+/Mg2+ efflux protein ApaG [Algoriphagus sp. AGSA1]MCE7056486.1 Co2+/Mg2+ efflux protein ApaG [Algoriphagus sp. AGSA1]
MVVAVTSGIQVSVEVTYQAEFSSPHQHHFVFTYKVTIENKSNQTVQLLRRRWEISDAAELKRTVEGDGVVGQQPILEPGESHSYVSGCNLKSGLGKMTGAYYMEKLFDGAKFEVIIPEFQMIANYLHN